MLRVKLLACALLFWLARPVFAQTPPNTTAHQHWFSTCSGLYSYAGRADGWCFLDDFIAAVYNDHVWRALPVGIANGSDIAVLTTTTTGGIVGALRLTAGSTSSDAIAIDWNNINPLPLAGTGPTSSRLMWEMLFRFQHTATGNRFFLIGVQCDSGVADLYWDSSDGSVFKFRTASISNACGGAGVTCTTLASGWGLTDANVDWKIQFVGVDQDSGIDRWILFRNNVRVACHANGVVSGCTNTANIPTGDCEIGAVLTNRTNGATRAVDLDYMAVIARMGDWSR